MANSKAVSVRIPDEYLAKIDELAEKKHKSIKGTPVRSLVILDAIVAYFDTVPDAAVANKIIAVSDTVRVEDFKALQEIVAALVKDIDRLKSSSDLLMVAALKSDGPSPEGISQHLQLTAFPVSDTVVDFRIAVDLLAKRIGVKNPKSIQNKKSRSSSNEFSEWTAKKDLDGIPWTSIKIGRLSYFTPATDLSDELKSKLQNWLESENTAISTSSPSWPEE